MIVFHEPDSCQGPLRHPVPHDTPKLATGLEFVAGREFVSEDVHIGCEVSLWVCVATGLDVFGRAVVLF